MAKYFELLVLRFIQPSVNFILVNEHAVGTYSFRPNMSNQYNKSYHIKFDSCY